MLSGIMISESAMPTLGIALPMNFAWRRLHDMSANIALIIMGLHLAMHWNWIVTTFKRVFLSGGKQQTVATAKQEM
jgi:sulfite exporter TauE/SafE